MKMKCLKFDQKINVTKKRMNLFSKKTGWIEPSNCCYLSYYKCSSSNRKWS
jgi:hypothetical protein